MFNSQPTHHIFCQLLQKTPTLDQKLRHSKLNLNMKELSKKKIKNVIKKCLLMLTKHLSNINFTSPNYSDCVLTVSFSSSGLPSFNLLFTSVRFVGWLLELVFFATNCGGNGTNDGDGLM